MARNIVLNYFCTFRVSFIFHTYYKLHKLGPKTTSSIIVVHVIIVIRCDGIVAFVIITMIEIIVEVYIIDRCRCGKSVSFDNFSAQC